MIELASDLGMRSLRFDVDGFAWDSWLYKYITRDVRDDESPGEAHGRHGIRDAHE